MTLVDHKFKKLACHAQVNCLELTRLEARLLVTVEGEVTETAEE